MYVISDFLLRFTVLPLRHRNFKAEDVRSSRSFFLSSTQSVFQTVRALLGAYVPSWTIYLSKYTTYHDSNTLSYRYLGKYLRSTAPEADEVEEGCKVPQLSISSPPADGERASRYPEAQRIYSGAL